MVVYLGKIRGRESTSKHLGVSNLHKVAIHHYAWEPDGLEMINMLEDVHMPCINNSSNPFCVTASLVKDAHSRRLGVSSVNGMVFIVLKSLGDTIIHSVVAEFLKECANSRRFSLVA